MRPSQLQHVADLSQVAEARRSAVQLGSALGFSDEAAGNLAIVATELATNLANHAQGGNMLFRPLDEHTEAPGVEVLAIDTGPGMANVSQCMRDGYSTGGTPGNGLGAVRRLSRVFDVYSKPSRGTVIVSQVWPGGARGDAKAAAARSSGRRSVFGAVNLAVRGETECGDSWSHLHGPGTTSVMLIDGLGHGPIAAQAAASGVKAFEASRAGTAKERIALMNDALRPTRGAAGAVSLIDHKRGCLSYCGIGNITAVVVSGESERHLVSHNGTLGHDAKTLREFEYPWDASSMLIMASDGLTSRWTLSPYPGLGQRHPSVIAGVMYRDFCRGRDDVTVVVYREGEA